MIESARVESRDCACKSCVCQKPVDAKTGFEISDDFQRFNQKYDMFNRAVWDDTVRSERSQKFFESYFTDLAEFRKVEGFQHRDYALRNAAWYIADFTADLLEMSGDRKEGFLDTYTMFREGATRKIEGSAEENTAELKRAGKFLGADAIGVCDYDERWVYTHNYSRQKLTDKAMDLPEGMSSVVVIVNEMHHQTIRTVPSALSGAATGQGYSRDIIAVLSITQYIRNLGYRAVASLNDTALSIPLAVQAGLGQYGRHGLLITPEFGPRVRIAKVFTDLPLNADEPIDFGVTETCNTCRRCSVACPVKAIPFDEPGFINDNISHIKGVRKWTIDAKKCFKFWANQGTDCSICIRVCPYNKDFSKAFNRLLRWMLSNRWRRLALWLDGKLKYGQRRTAGWWWRQPSA
ncbi:MAG: reductive dehalogenase [Chloroflexi bacterium]|nr:reductive dehalogenase [Chloroflexota bacterium]